MDFATVIYILFWLPLLIFNNLCSIPAYFCYILFLTPIYFVSKRLYWRIESRLHRYLAGVVGSWTQSTWNIFQTAGDDLSDVLNEPTVVLFNHQSTADVPIAMSWQDSLGASEYMTWLMDNLFRYTNFGIVSMHHGDFFTYMGKETRQKQLSELRRHFSTVVLDRGRKWYNVYPEGGFLSNMKAKSLEYAKKNDLPVLENVALPRVGAFYHIIDTLCPCDRPAHPDEGLPGAAAADNKPDPSADVVRHRPAIPGCRLKWVLDVTYCYERGDSLDFVSLAFNLKPRARITMFCRKFPIHSIPKSEAGISKWLTDLYAEKDAFLAHYYKTNMFPPVISVATGKDVSQDVRPWDPMLWNYRVLQVFWHLSTLFWCWFYYSLFSSFWSML